MNYKISIYYIILSVGKQKKNTHSEGVYYDINLVKNVIYVNVVRNASTR